MYPRLAEGVVVRDRDCAFTQPHDRIAISATNEDYALNKRLADLLRSADGENSVHSLCQTFGAETEQVLGDLENANIIITQDRPARNLSHARQFVARSGLVASCRSVIWHLTRRCNLACAHCYYLDQKEEKEEFAPEEISRVVANLVDLGVEYVTITGGEVLASQSNLWKAIDELTDHCIPFGINTNATRKISELADKLQSSSYARIVQSSIDGPPEVHDRMRGKSGSHDKTMANLRHLARRGVFTRVVSMLTEDWMNPDTVMEVAARLSDAGVRDWLLEVPNTTGRWKRGVDTKLHEQLCRTASGFYDYLAAGEHGFKRAGLNQVFEWPMSMVMPKRLSDPACHHDLGLLSFGPEGVSFCTMFREQFGPAWKNMHDPTMPMQPAWDRIVQTRIDHRLKDNPACSNCELFDWCQGGCPGGYEKPAEFSGCDHHSRFLALVKQKLFADGILPGAFAPVLM